MLSEGEGNVKVLVVPPIIERNFTTFVKLVDDEHLRDWFTFYTIHPVPVKKNGSWDAKEILQQCRKVIAEQNITVLFANQDIGIFISAVLCQEHPKIIGPSIESVFLCAHKYYTVTHLDSRKEKLPYRALNVQNDVYDLAGSILSNLKMPCILQSCLGRGVSFARNRDELIKALKESSKGVESAQDVYEHLVKNYVDLSRYPNAIKPVIIARSYVERGAVVDESRAAWVNAYVEACVYQGKIIPWALASNVLPKDQSMPNHLFSGFEMPSSLSMNLQAELWDAFRADVRKLVEKNFNNSFVYGEYKVFGDGYIHLERLVPCAHCDFTPMYQQALSQGNNVHAALQLSLQIRPDAPKANGCYVLCHTMITIVLEVGKSSNLIRFDKAQAHSDCVSLRYLPSQDIEIDTSRNHAVIGTIVVKAANFKTCLAKIKEIRKEVLRMPELVPLTICF